MLTMTVLTPISQIILTPGSAIAIQDISWPAFEAILEELGENRNTRIAYHQGTLEIVSPLPRHERAIVVISDLVKTLLRLQNRPWESLRSSTLKRQGIAGIEPDDCFYIEHYRTAIGKDRLDLAIDLPPDLAIESDLTSKTQTDAYLAVRVPELWVYGSGKLVIYRLQKDAYIESLVSPTFPGLDLTEIVAKTVERAWDVGTSQALQELEDWLHQHG